MSSNVYAGKKMDVRRLVVIGVLSGISMMLSMTPLGFIPIGPVSATTMHIPVLVGAVLEGPIVGLCVGLIFGITSLVKALTMPTVASFLMINPIVSIVPRAIMGFATYYIFASLMKVTKKKKLSALLTGMLGSMINTVGVLGAIYFLYGKQYVEVIGKNGSPAKIIGFIAVTNGLPEALLAGMIVSAVVMIVKRK